MRIMYKRMAIMMGVLLFLMSCVSTENIVKGRKYTGIQWKNNLRTAVFSSITINSELGVAYVGTQGRGLFALDVETGKKLWTFSREEKTNFNSTPALADDGTIIIGSDEGILFALNPDGTEKWSYLTSGSILSSPAIGSDGTIYFGSGDQKIYAISLDGDLKWFINTTGLVYSSPVIGKDGTIYIGSHDELFYAILPKGEVKWSFKTLGPIYSQAAISADNKTVYFTSSDSKVYAIDVSTAQLRWFVDTPVSIFSSPVIDANGNILFAADSLYAISPEGETLWKVGFPGTAIATPAIGVDGTIYLSSIVTNDTSYFSIVGSNGNIMGLKSFSRDLRSSPVISESGDVIFGGNLGYVYALKGTGEKPATHNWAMFRNNERRTGIYAVE